MMRRYIRKYDTQIEWLLGAFAVVTPLIVFITSGDLEDVSLYTIFPILGMMAFGLMWTHFIMGAVRRYAGSVRQARRAYMALSMGLVLALIILHPVLFWLALYMDGLGLPPQSYMQVYATQLGFITLGIIGLTIFLAYELKRFFGQRRWWKYVEWLQIVGMAVIFVHTLGLGSDVNDGWYGWVWVSYGITLAIAVGYSNLVYKKKEN